jgi:hypothetical protein
MSLSRSKLHGNTPRKLHFTRIRTRRKCRSSISFHPLGGLLGQMGPVITPPDRSSSCVRAVRPLLRPGPHPVRGSANRHRLSRQALFPSILYPSFLVRVGLPFLRSARAGDDNAGPPLCAGLTIVSRPSLPQPRRVCCSRDDEKSSGTIDDRKPIGFALPRHAAGPTAASVAVSP